MGDTAYERSLAPDHRRQGRARSHPDNPSRAHTSITMPISSNAASQSSSNSAVSQPASKDHWKLPGGRHPHSHHSLVVIRVHTTYGVF